MDLDLVFLGTSASMPTAQRAPAAFLVRRGGERLLFDCAEGTQRQLQRSSVGLPDIEEIFLTHFHADHFLGLPGMLKTFALRGRDDAGLTVYGPEGIRDLFSRRSRSSAGCRTASHMVELGEQTLELGVRSTHSRVDHRGGARLRARRARPPGRFDWEPPTRSGCRRAASAASCRAASR